MRLRTLKMQAEKIIGEHIDAEMTSNFDYFMRRTSEVYNLSVFDKFLLYPFKIIFYFVAASNGDHKIVYIPRLWLKSKKFSLGLAVHELLHVEYPDLSEDEVNFLSRRFIAWTK